MNNTCIEPYLLKRIRLASRSYTSEDSCGNVCPSCFQYPHCFLHEVLHHDIMSPALHVARARQATRPTLLHAGAAS